MTAICIFFSVVVVVVVYRTLCFIDVVMEQPIPNSVCRKEVYLKEFSGLGAG